MAKRQLRRSYDDKGLGGKRIYGDRKRKRLDEVVDMVDLTKKLQSLRLVGPIVPYAQWWIDILVQNNKVVSIPKVCPAFDPETGEIDDNIEDPYSELDNEKRLQVRYYVNAIVRLEQDKEPKNLPDPTPEEDKTGFKTKDSPTWTPVRVLGIPPMVAQKLQELQTQNRHAVKNRKTGRTVKKAFDLTHPKFGRDILISYDKDAGSPANYYNTSLDERSPLTDDEMEYFIWDIEGLAGKDGVFEPESPEEAKREAAALAGKVQSEKPDEESPESLGEDFMPEDDGDDLDDDLPWDDPESQEDEPAPPRRRRRRRRSTRSDGGDENAKPRRKRRKQAAQKSDSGTKPRRKRRRLRSET